MSLSTNYERPVKATLRVVTEQGEEWDATPGDLAKFGYVPRDAFTRSRMDLEKLLGFDLSNHEHDAPEGREALWEGVHLAAYLVEALTIYDFATLDHPEYREDAMRLGQLLGIASAAPAAL